MERIYVVIKRDKTDLQCCAAFATSKEADAYALAQSRLYPDLIFHVRGCPAVGAVRALGHD